MKMKKILAFFLALSLFASAFPLTAFADETEVDAATAVGSVVAPKDNLFLSNIAELEEDGTYTINLSAYATAGRVTQTLESGYPLDVVLVISQAGTLHENGKTYDGAPLAALKQSVTDFVNGLKADGEANGHQHRIAICGYAGDEYGGWDNMVKDNGELYGYSFAGDQKDWIFTNTGLFVNGKFKNYGSGTHTPLTEEEMAVDKLMDGTTFVAKAKGNHQEKFGDQYYIIKYEQSKKQWYYFRYANFGKLHGSPEVGKVVNKVTTTPEHAVAWLTERFDLYKHDNTITYNLNADDYKNSWEYVSDNGALNEDITKAIDSLAANGGRYAFYGLKMARQMLKNAPDIEDEEGVERKKIVIVFANERFGSTGDTNYNLVRAEAQKIKSDPEDGAEIYTVGINSNPKSDLWSAMEMMSSDAYTYKMTSTGKQTAYATSTSNRLVKNNLVRYTGVYFYMVTNDDGTVDYYPVIAYSDPDGTNHKWYYVTDTGKVHIESNDGQNSLGGVYHIESNSYDAATGYCLRSDDYNDLSGLFLSVIEKSKICHNGKLDKQSRLKYVLADNFKLTEKSTITVSVVPGSVSEENSNLSPKELTSDKITWGKTEQLLSYSYDTSSHSYPCTVPGAADQTKMTIYARAYATGEIVFTGFNYALQCIYADHAGSKLEVKITGVEAKPGVATNTEEFINHNTSGIYEGTDRDWDGDGTKGNIQMVLPDAKTYLPAVTYQVNHDGSVTIDPEDFSAVHVSLDGYNYFDPPCTTISMEYGQVTINNDGTVTYEKFHPEWEHNEVFYLLGKIDNTNVEGASTNVDDYMWYKITIVDSEDSRGSLFLDKTATLTDNGTYTIDLEAYATGTPSKSIVSEGIPLDVVLVIDQSGSLAYEKDEKGNLNFNGVPLKRLKESVTEFVDILKANGEAYGINHRISMCGFASGERTGSSGTTYVRGYTYASDLRQEAWCNTGLFVDGKFREYATMEYVPVEKMEDLDPGRQYSVRIDPDGDGNYEYTSAHYSTRYGWLYNYGRGSGYLIQPTEQEVATTQLFWEKYKGRIYLPGKSTLQLKDADYAASWENIASGENGQGGVNPDITNVIDKLAANGATYTIYGLKMARHMLNNIPELNDGVKRKKVVIVFTDGVPGSNGITDGDADAALSEAMKIKNENIEIYAIGVYQEPSSSEVHDFMNRLSSNYYSHSFATEPVEIDMSQIKYQDRSGNTSLNATIGGSYPDGNGAAGITPYYYKKDDAYYPIVISNNYENPDVYYASYISGDEKAGGVLIGRGDWDEIPEIVGPVYMLTEHKIYKDRDTNYYKYSDDIDNMTEIFEKIASKVTSNSIEVSLGVEAIMKDVLANGFELTDNTTITVSVEPGTVRDDCQDLPTHMLTAEKINWGNKTQVLSFAYPAKTSGTGTVTVNGAADQTPMTLTATVENGVISVTGFNYAKPEDADNINAQYISYGHPGSKLVVTITGVEAKSDIVTDSFTVTNKGTSGIYEGLDIDMDDDGDKNELQASFPVPTTYLTAKTYYVDYSGELVIDPKDFHMNIAGISADIDGYHYFNTNTPGTTLELEHGTVTVREDGKWLFTMDAGDWSITDSFFLFGTTDDPTVTGAVANADGNMWSKITIITPKDNSGKVFLDKEATLTDDGTYTIDLSAYATGTPITKIVELGVPLDVVLVIDQSGSLFINGGKYDGVPLKLLKESVTEFVETLKANGEAYGVNHRISMCGFASGELSGASGTTAAGYSYASDMRYNSWLNTGLFVNGEFREYAKMNYIRINDPSELDVNRYCTVKFDPKGDGNYEYVSSLYSEGRKSFRYWDGIANSEVVGGDNKEDIVQRLLKSYEVYKHGKSTVQLDDADYAASWENLASGENGQGSINPDILKSIDKLASNGLTNTFYGMMMASRMLENAPDIEGEEGVERKKVVIVFTDGEPGSNGYVKGDGDAALSAVRAIKDAGAEVYTVGIYSAASEAKVHTFMNHLSSNYKSHSFTTTPTRIDMSQVKTDRTGNTRLADNIDSGSHGISPYYKKVGNDYWPVVISKNYENPGVYYASYITYRAEEGGVLIGSGDWEKIPEIVGDVYMLAEPEINENRVTDYYKYSGDINELSAIFQELATDATTFNAQVSLDATAILKDVMADGFTLTDNTQITVSVVPGSVSEENSNLSPNELTSDKITWSEEAKQVLTMNARAQTAASEPFVVTGAFDQTEMTLTATAENGEINVTGYNYAAQFISKDHVGSKLVVTITGVEAVTGVTTNAATSTNKATSGVYEGPESDMDKDGIPGEIETPFPVPTTYLTSEVYVVDYAKTLTVDPADWKMNGGAISVDADGYNHFNPATTVVTDAYGKVTVSDDGKVTYTPTKTNWKGFDTFHVFGTTNDETVKAATANGNGNMWAKVSVIPANNVYFEDTFVTSEDTGIAGIVYGGVWDNVWYEVDKDGKPNAGGNGQGENAESGESSDGDNQGGVHGWENTLADDKDFSDGSAHVSTTPGATATFTFTGTGVDIYSRTNMETGIVMAMLYEGESTTDKDGKNLVAKYGLMVDNLAASGDYYQIPTLSLCQIPAEDENGNTVMKDLPYGTYTVMLVVSQASDSQTGEERFTYYLDGIRVYNPIKELEKDSTVSGAYGDKELNAKFVEVRDKLLDANSFVAEDDYAGGPVFIDRITSEDGVHTDYTDTYEIGEYKVFGPENEVYLSPESCHTIAFAVEYQQGAHYYMGMKSLTGECANVIITGPDDQVTFIPVEHTTDMYYEVSPAWTDFEGNPYTDTEGNRIGIITVMADCPMDENGDYIDNLGAILALTKLKVTGPEAKTFKFARVSKTMLLDRVQELANTLPDVENPDSGTQIEPEKQLGMVDKWNIALQEDFEVKFYLQISEDIEDAAKVSLTIGNGNITYDVSTLEKTEDGYYLLKARLAATQMSDKISVQIIHGEDKGEIFTYTVREYCDTILSKDEYSAYHALVKEMLNYGAMAQMYFNYDVQNLANAGMTGAAAVAVPETAKDMAVTDKLSALNFYGASLVYRDKIALRYYFTGDVTGLTFTANGKTYEPVAKDGMHYVEIADILPQNVDQQITLTVTDANGNILAVTYGPMNYIVRMNVKGNDALKNLMSALYNYHLAAKALYQQ